ncbi:bifunctional metallophosphatase/5'-nucleotidase [Pendulispora albinea]|uniref:Bifunctional metallophosphatase/5'-nucleotidase n=1 Tax=Pendulispora albinea TaxID=2741071 RepID=A0ABZ2M947_9BACT
MRLRRSTVLFSIPAALAAASIPLAVSCSDESTLVANPSDASIDRAPPSTSDSTAPVKVQILGFNDFHGNLEEPTGNNANVLAEGNDPAIGDAGVPLDGSTKKNVPAGGVVFLAAHIAKLRAQNPNTAVVSSGDMTGASPLVSAIFSDEPTVLAMNAIGLDFNGVGNHEFDHGVGELLRLQYGGCHPTKGCPPDIADFPGAKYRYLAANVDVAKDRTIFPAYGIKELGGQKVAFIGMTLKDTPSVTVPSAVAGLKFDDEVATVNELIPKIKGEGASAIVVLLHQGNIPLPGTVYSDCGVESGTIVDIAKKLDPAVSVVFSAHTHQAYNCKVRDGAGGEKLVTSAASFGRVVTQVELTIDPVQHKVTEKSAKNHIVTRDIAPDPAVKQILDTYKTLAGPVGNEPIGRITGALTKDTTSASGEWIIGDVIADAMLAGMQDPKKPGYDAVIALMNAGGVRASVPCDGCSEASPGTMTYAQAFTVQPFTNYLVTVSLTGAQIETLLNQQGKGILQIAGLKYAYKRPGGGAPVVEPNTIQVREAGGYVALDPAKTYRVVTNNFLATGGDGFDEFKKATNPTNGPIDLDALIAYMKANNPLKPPALDRITRLP